MLTLFLPPCDIHVVNRMPQVVSRPKQFFVIRQSFLIYMPECNRYILCIYLSVLYMACYILSMVLAAGFTIPYHTIHRQHCDVTGYFRIVSHIVHTYLYTYLMNLFACRFLQIRLRVELRPFCPDFRFSNNCKQD